MNPLVEALEQDVTFSEVAAVEVGGGYELRMTADWSAGGGALPVWEDEVRPRLAELAGSDPAVLGLLSRGYDRVVAAVAERPIYLTVPRRTLDVGHREREYEYFFASQTLMIATDLLGFVLIGLLVWLERRGVITRAGVQEDLDR